MNDCSRLAIVVGVRVVVARVGENVVKSGLVTLEN